MNRRKKECAQFCEQCGDCLECYADEVCSLTKLRTLHGEMLKNEEKSDDDILREKLIGAKLQDIFHDDLLGFYRLVFVNSENKEIKVLARSVADDASLEIESD